MNSIRKTIVFLLLTGICVAQSAPGEGNLAGKSSAHRVARKTVKHTEPAVSAEDIKQLKELIQAQQVQIDQLKQQASQRDQQAEQAQRAAIDAEKAAADAQDKAVATAMADTNSKIETVKSDVADLKTTATNVAVTTQGEQKRVGALESLNSRFRFSGDVRVRYENFFQRSSAPSHPEDKERFRLRLRFGVDGKVSEDFVGGLAIATGSQADPTSTNQTLGDSGNSPNFERKTINLDRAYITWNPQAYKWLSVTGGKFAYPWVRTNPTFDPDINPEGFSEKVTFKTSNAFLKEVSATGLQLVLQTNNASTTPNTDSWAYGGQVGAKLQIGSRWTMVPTYALLNFVRPNGAIFGVKGAGPAFAPNFMDNCTKTGVKYGSATGTGFCSNFQYSDLIVSNVVKTGIERLPLGFTGEYEKNLRANPSPIDQKHHDTLYYLEASLGQLKNKGDVQFGYAYTHTEQDAVISSFVESDQFHQTNNEQNRIFFTWKVRSNTTLGYTQWIGRFLDMKLVPAATATNNPYLKRGQLDVVYSF
ncbi:MAG TPA: putative porin [Candidatus Saccharimonadales bacterium]|nr:putative porin [Candidatus Saccharimonadales bacterium]